MRAAQSLAACTGLLLVLGLGTSCSDDHSPLDTGGPDAQVSAPAPGGLVSLGDGFELFPYTSTDFEGGQSDPINLIFTGNPDPRAIRAALLGLDGDRTAFGPLAAFDCTWRDALGGSEQVTYAGEAWSGSVVQLACGEYGPVRFHLRLFPAGSYTVANAHFEVLIPGTTDHQVLSWYLAEELVWVDMLRTGVAEPAGDSPVLSPPAFRTIPSVIFNGLPAELQYLASGSTGPVAADVPIVNGDGKAKILAVGGVPVGPGVDEQSLVIEFDQVIPKPFCAAGGVQYVYVTGPVDLYQRDEVTADGAYEMQFRAEGALNVVPIDGSTGQPDPSRAYTAIVREKHHARFWDGFGAVSSSLTQSEVPPTGDERGRLTIVLAWGPNGKTDLRVTERCQP